MSCDYRPFEAFALGFQSHLTMVRHVLNVEPHLESR